MTQIKNFAYTIPTAGRITIGERVERGGKTLPAKRNHFTIRMEHKRDEQYVVHPVQAHVLAETGQTAETLRSIPIKVMFNDPDLIVREQYEAYGPDGRMLCVGDGQCARRKIGGEIQSVACAGADHCEYGRAARCKLATRLNVQIDVKDTPECRLDPLSSFAFRSTGFNTARTLSSKLRHLAAMLNGRLCGVPLELCLRQKSSTLSYDSVFFYVDIVTRQDLITSAQLAKNYADAMVAVGLNQEAYESAVREGLANGPFEDTSEDFLGHEESTDFNDHLGSEPQGGKTVSRGAADDETPATAHVIESPMAWMDAVRTEFNHESQIQH